MASKRRPSANWDKASAPENRWPPPVRGKHPAKGCKIAGSSSMTSTRARTRSVENGRHVLEHGQHRGRKRRGRQGEQHARAAPVHALQMISPSRSCTMRCAIDRPSPVPTPTGLVVKNGSKTRPRFSWAMPQPVSSISSVGRSRASSRVRTVIVLRSTAPTSIECAALIKTFRDDLHQLGLRAERQRDTRVFFDHARSVTKLVGRDAQRPFAGAFQIDG